MVQAVRVNQWMVHGANLEKAALDKAVWETFRITPTTYMTCIIYPATLNETQHIISLDPVARGLVERPGIWRPGIGDHRSSSQQL